VRAFRRAIGWATGATLLLLLACGDEDEPPLRTTDAGSAGRSLSGAGGRSPVGAAGRGGRDGATQGGGDAGERGDVAPSAGRSAGGTQSGGKAGSEPGAKGGSSGQGAAGEGGGGGEGLGASGGESSGAGGDAGSWNGPSCWLPQCGNGVKEAFEACDDGNADDDDDCTRLCLRPEHFRCEGCERQVCGNGVVEYGANGCTDVFAIEHCDDGNTDGGDGCDPDCGIEWTHVCPPQGGPCRLPACGDGIADGGFLVDGLFVEEECDDAIDEDCAGCRVAASCGDGMVRGHEQCDDANSSANDGCHACQIESRTWECPEGGGACYPIVCGDGSVAPKREVCDDGNQISGDGCSEACELEVCSVAGCRVPRCGDGYVDAVVFQGIRRFGDFGAEACDDGNTLSGDGCTADCTALENGWVCEPPGSACEPAYCGDGVVSYQYWDGERVREESCDDGNDVEGDGCTDCHSDDLCLPPSAEGASAPSCGNGRLEVGEVCDDGNDESGDGCVECALEPEFDCLSEAGVCRFAPCGNGVRDSFVWNGCTWKNERCDDGNRIDGDGCSSRCELEPYHACPPEGGSCLPATCGDGVVSDYLTLDNGFVQEVEDSGTFCRWVGFPHHALGCNDEHYAPECNDHNQTVGDGCTPDCELEPGPWVCPGTFPFDCHLAVCGDGVVEAFVEQCDDANDAPGDGCSVDCVNEICDASGCHVPSCGNGVLEPVFRPGHSRPASVEDELCDDGNTDDGDGCSRECVREVGFVCPVPGAPCAPPRCGDGVVTWLYWDDSDWHAEQCDDGNTTACDGCTDCELDSACHTDVGPRFEL
jgi:cysteine-rich repeat protein